MKIANICFRVDSPAPLLYIHGRKITKSKKDTVRAERTYALMLVALMSFFLLTISHGMAPLIYGKRVIVPMTQ